MPACKLEQAEALAASCRPDVRLRRDLLGNVEAPLLEKLIASGSDGRCRVQP